MRIWPRLVFWGIKVLPGTFIFIVTLFVNIETGAVAQVFASLKGVGRINTGSQSPWVSTSALVLTVLLLLFYSRPLVRAIDFLGALAFVEREEGSSDWEGSSPQCRVLAIDSSTLGSLGGRGLVFRGWPLAPRASWVNFTCTRGRLDAILGRYINGLCWNSGVMLSWRQLRSSEWPISHL